MCYYIDNKKLSIKEREFIWMENYTLNQLSYFYKLAEKLNYRTAAEELLISEPALSKQIKQLENAFSVKLFNKVGRNIQLTEEGKQIALKIGQVLREVDALNQVVSQFDDPNSATLKIGISGNQFIYKYVHRLKEKFNNLKISIHEMETNMILSALKKNEIDIGVLYEDVSDSQLVTHAIFNDEIVALDFSEDENGADFISSAELKNKDMAVLRDGYFIRGMIDDYFASHLITPNYQFELNNYQSCIRIAEEMKAVTFVTTSYLDSIDASKLNVLKINDMHSLLKMSLVTPKEKSISEPIRELINLINKKD